MALLTSGIMKAKIFFLYLHAELYKPQPRVLSFSKTFVSQKTRSGFPMWQNCAAVI
jgi:hypothetical protein